MQFDLNNDDTKIAGADPCKEISFQTMILGLLAKHILPNSTVLGFTRSGQFINDELLKNKAEIFSFVDLTRKDVETMIEVIERPEQRRVVLQFIRSISSELRHQILFVKEIIKLSIKGKIQIGDISSASDLFLTIILGNLQHQDPDGKLVYSKLPADSKNYLKKILELCKDKLQSQKFFRTDGVIKGDEIEDGKWRSRDSNITIPLEFLCKVGVFEISPSVEGEVTLTARHLSFIEFLAAAGILLSSDIESELGKIENTERFRAVTVYIRNDFVKKNIRKNTKIYLILFFIFYNF